MRASHPQNSLHRRKRPVITHFNFEMSMRYQRTLTRCRPTLLLIRSDCEGLQLGGYLAGRVQFEELASSMRHAADFGHAEFEAGLVTPKIIADQIAPTVLQKVASMISCVAGAEVINHCCHVRELAGGVGPHIGTVAARASAPVFHQRARPAAPGGGCVESVIINARVRNP